MRLPIHILEEGVELPKEGTFYILARDGLYIHRENDLIEAVVKVPQISALAPVVPRATLRVPAIPAPLVARIIGFFRHVWRVYGTEALVMLHWGGRLRGWRIEVPRQEVTIGSITYAKDERFTGYQLVGTIHAHPGNAYHSGTDRCDEDSLDGLHVTIGHLGETTHDIASVIVVNGNRFPVPADTYLSGIRALDRTPEGAPEPPRERPCRKQSLLERIFMLPEIDYKDIFERLGEDVHSREKVERFDVVVPFPKGKWEYAFPGRWMEQVHRKPFLARESLRGTGFGEFAKGTADVEARFFGEKKEGGA